jgi:hypothetical protein
MLTVVEHTTPAAPQPSAKLDRLFLHWGTTLDPRVMFFLHFWRTPPTVDSPSRRLISREGHLKLRKIDNDWLLWKYVGNIVYCCHRPFACTLDSSRIITNLNFCFRLSEWTCCMSRFTDEFYFLRRILLFKPTRLGQPDNA